MMWRREELLKSIWHAFTALDVDRSGKVSKSQLKVLSHNLYTVMKIPHDPVALEEHFKDNNEGPVSNQGYMPYLKEFILDKAQDNFDVLEFNTMCWTLCYKKYINVSPLLISNDDAFKVWCIFNFLSEDTYPLVIITEEMEYFLQKLMETMGSSWNKEKSEEFKLQLNGKNSLSTWELIQLVGMGYFSKGLNRQTLSMGIGEVFQELIQDMLKQGYLMKKGHGRKNWTEQWFVLRPNAVSYFASEALGDKKGEIALSRDCSVESLPDKEGRKCLFIIKCTDKSFEISASDKKKKQEWIQAIQACVQQLRLGLLPLHREARLRRRELRQRQHSQHEEITERMNQLLAANERKQMQLEFMRKKLDEASAKAATEEQRRKQTQADLQDRFTLDLEKEKMVREQMEQLVAQKSSEVEQYLQRVRELEELYHSLEEALENERQAKQDEEAMHQLQSRLLEEEVGKRAELELLHLQQQRTISQATAEKQELQAEHRAKEEALQAAALQLQSLERERMGAVEQYQEVAKRLERAANKTKSWKDKVTKHEGMLRLIQPGDKGPQRVTNWGPASFTDAELEFRKKLWQERKNQNDPSE